MPLQIEIVEAGEAGEFLGSQKVSELSLGNMKVGGRGNQTQKRHLKTELL